MVNKKPQFKINEKIMTEVIDIAELVGKVSISNQISANPTLLTFILPLKLSAVLIYILLFYLQ